MMRAATAEEAACLGGDDVGAVDMIVPPRSFSRSSPVSCSNRRETAQRSSCCEATFERAAAAAVAAAADLKGAPMLPTFSTPTFPTMLPPSFSGALFGGASRPNEPLQDAASTEDMDSVAAALEIPELAHHPSAVASWVAAAIDARVAESEERRMERSLSSSAACCSSATSSSSAEEGEEGGGKAKERAPLRSCSSSSSLSSSSPTAAHTAEAEAADAAAVTPMAEEEEPPRSLSPGEGGAGGKEPRQRLQRQRSSTGAPAAPRSPGSGSPALDSPSPPSTPYARPRSHLTPFHGAAPPPLSLGAYAERLASHLRPSPLAFAHALELLDRLAAADPMAAPAPDTAHRLLLAGVAVAAKLTDDRVRRAEVVARVGGVPAAELAGLELALLRGVGFRAHVARGELLQRVRELKEGGTGGAPAAAAAAAAAVAAAVEETGAST